MESDVPLRRELKAHQTMIGGCGGRRQEHGTETKQNNKLGLASCLVARHATWWSCLMFVALTSSQRENVQLPYVETLESGNKEVFAVGLGAAHDVTNHLTRIWLYAFTRNGPGPNSTVVREAANFQGSPDDPPRTSGCWLASKPCLRMPRRLGRKAE